MNGLYLLTFLLQRLRADQSARWLWSDSSARSALPYAFIHDPKQVEARKAELEASIGQWRDVLASYRARIDEMLG